MKRYTSKGYQGIRLVDVFYIAPIMILAGVFGKTLHPVIRVSLVVIGICTAIFNLNNYIETKKHLKDQSINSNNN